MVNILERRFVIFGQTFWPQDIHLFVLAFITGIVFIALFTVVFGRLFCGWVCPRPSSWRWCSGRSSTPLKVTGNNSSP